MPGEVAFRKADGETRMALRKIVLEADGLDILAAFDFDGDDVGANLEDEADFAPGLVGKIEWLHLELPRYLLEDVVFRQRPLEQIGFSEQNRLVGDARRIERALIDVLAYIIHLDCAEAVKISAYGAQREESVHVLVSIKANGSNIGEKEASEFSDFIAKAESGDAHHISDDIKELEGIALTILLMGAKLQMVNEPGESLELYFELEQDIARDASASGDDDGA